MIKDLYVLKLALLFLIGLFCTSAVKAQEGYQLKFKLEGVQDEYALLANYVGVKQYITDTVSRDSDGWYTTTKNDTLEAGLYLIYFPGAARSFDLMITSKDPKDQQFTMSTDTIDPVGNMKITGKTENKEFYEYLQQLNKKAVERKVLVEEAQAAKEEKKQAKLYDKIDALDAEVKQYQLDYVNNNPGYLSSAIIKSSMDVDIPEPTKIMTEEEESDWRYYYYKDHFFDNINFSDGRLIRTPVYQNRLDRYINKMLLPVPDSLYDEVDYILKKAEVNSEMFRFSLVHLINHYGKSKIVGMDAMYVYLVDNYYAKGLAPWTNEETLTKMKKRAKELRPILIGKRAPNIQITELDKGKITLYEVEAEYTILYFWDPKCGHCNKVAPDLVEFAEIHQGQDIKIFSVCTKDKKADMCRDAIEEKGFDGFINVLATEDRELYYRLNYAVKTTPMVFVLDENKVIQSKGIGPGQLTEVIELLRKRKADQQTN